MYNQRNKKWADLKINGTNSTMGSYGCFITSLAWLAGIKPDEALHKLEKGGGLSRDLVLSEKSAEILGLDYFPPARSPELSVSYTCIAEVDFSTNPGKQQHFVVLEPDGTQLDPWTGLTSNYPIVTKRLFRNSWIQGNDICEETTKNIADKVDFDYGDNLNENEAKDLVKKIDHLVKDNDALEQLSETQLKIIAGQSEEMSLKDKMLSASKDTILIMQENIDGLEKDIVKPKYDWHFGTYTIKVWSDGDI